MVVYKYKVNCLTLAEWQGSYKTFEEAKDRLRALRQTYKNLIFKIYDVEGKEWLKE